jgi:hypothetical protein
MNAYLILGTISVFALGWILNNLTGWPTLWVVCACLVAQIGLIIVNTRRGKK